MGSQSSWRCILAESATAPEMEAGTYDKVILPDGAEDE